MEATQVILTFLIFVLGLTLVLIGWQLFFILRELSQTLRKFNTVLEEVDNIGKNLNRSSQQLVGLVEGLNQRLTGATHQTGGTLSGFLNGLLAVKNLVEIIRSKGDHSAKEVSDE